MSVNQLPLLPAHEADRLVVLRVRYIQMVGIFGVIAAIVTATAQQLTGTPPTISALIASIATGTILIGLVRWGKVQAATIGAVLGTAALSILTSEQAFLIAGLFLVLSTAVLANRPIYLLANALVLARGLYFIWISMGGQFTGTFPPDLSDKALHIVAILVVSSTTRYFINYVERASDEARLSASLLQAVAESGEILAKLLNLKQLLPRAVELIQERFAFYHVQIFLLDETGEYAALAASTGATGQKLMERRHRLAVGSQSVVGRVTATGQPVVARDTDPIYYRNELLPNTRSELALPITDGDRIIGVLDVQSRRPDAFEVESVQALQVMANLVGTSIRNARLFDQQARTANETKRLFLDAETNLREIQRLNQQLTHQGWEDFLHNKRQSSGVTLDDEQIISESVWTPALTKASQSRQVVTDLSNGHQVIAVPVVLGSEVIGAIEIEPSNPGQEAEVVEMVKAIAQRLAISLDKARLFEESQEATAQEQRINDIVARYQTVTNVDDLLQITLSELSTSLGAKRGAIRLGNVPAASLNGESQHD